ncbi:hypothetical protein H4Q26_003383 [Puccinia striiformis f. sp. tritici PST-130]|nr:hypothetical protein H4Q26_003383 [Puccinia striiformis f. sp. tritici PST-130]
MDPLLMAHLENSIESKLTISRENRSFRDKSRFLFTRAKAADSSGSLLAEVTNEAASATTTTSSLIGGATSPIRGVSPVGSGAGVETRANEDKSIIKLDDNFLDKPTGSKRDESDEQLTESQNNESIFTPSNGQPTILSIYRHKNLNLLPYCVLPLTHHLKMTKQKRYRTVENQDT